jgi:hypothetical protein
MFKTLKHLAITSEWTAKINEGGKMIDVGKLFISNYVGRIA